MAGRILNFEKVIVETVTVAVNGGPTWELRDDVPAGTLAMAFRVFDLERQMASRPEGVEPLTLDDERRILDEGEAATLDAVTAIVRHSYPEVTREDVAEALAPSARGRVLQVFFPLLLRRFGRQSEISPDGAPPTTALAPTAGVTPNRAQRRRQAAVDGKGTTPSPRS
jgi:hypothetical protein